MYESVVDKKTQGKELTTVSREEDVRRKHSGTNIKDIVENKMYESVLDKKTRAKELTTISKEEDVRRKHSGTNIKDLVENKMYESVLDKNTHQGKKLTAENDSGTKSHLYESVLDKRTQEKKLVAISKQEDIQMRENLAYCTARKAYLFYSYCSCRNHNNIVCTNTPHSMCILISRSKVYNITHPYSFLL